MLYPDVGPKAGYAGSKPPRATGALNKRRAAKIDVIYISWEKSAYSCRRKGKVASAEFRVALIVVTSIILVSVKRASSLFT